MLGYAMLVYASCGLDVIPYIASLFVYIADKASG